MLLYMTSIYLSIINLLISCQKVSFINSQPPVAQSILELDLIWNLTKSTSGGTFMNNMPFYYFDNAQACNVYLSSASWYHKWIHNKSKCTLNSLFIKSLSIVSMFTNPMATLRTEIYLKSSKLILKIHFVFSNLQLKIICMTTLFVHHQL